ncbi:protein amalgam isoform X2 [Eurytemora carolleeae]|uniref:protein amalgam isoform X2 n=1 Tax=Eurytemora carolleeae TaxID=1294199 RepID=UPI000C7563D5|nr:protein amalgam isoform X2 [Eurytemora carolleeae]XP_023336408.1 protein amalgam isoform X2 [Eurytemora carolleeae]|eukprot:XP_023336341.1 protein amalgam-like isoform X2 [Eurytemora affinis]
MLIHILIISLPVISLQGHQYEAEPRFINSVKNMTVSVGREAILSCSVVNLQDYKVGWIKASDQTILSLHKRVITNNKRIHVTHDEHNTWNLHIKDVVVEDRDCYMCQINTAIMKKQVGCVDVLVPPDIDVRTTSSDISVLEGSNITLTCVAHGLPSPKVTWRREDKTSFKLLSHNIVQTVTKFVGGTLPLLDVRRQHMGSFLCIANNNVPPAVSKRIMVHVNFSPSVVVQPQLIGIPVGERLVLNCSVEAYPAPITYWQKERGLSNNKDRSNKDKGNSSGKIMLISKSSTEYHTESHSLGYTHTTSLVIPSFSLEFSGVYECISSNSLGSQVAGARVYDIPGAASKPETSTKTTFRINIHTLKGHPNKIVCLSVRMMRIKSFTQLKKHGYKE